MNNIGERYRSSRYRSLTVPPTRRNANLALPPLLDKMDDDILLQHPSIAEGLVPCFEHMNTPDRGRIQQLSAKRPKIGTVAEAPRNDRDQLAPGLSKRSDNVTNATYKFRALMRTRANAAASRDRVPSFAYGGLRIAKSNRSRRVLHRMSSIWPHPHSTKSVEATRAVSDGSARLHSSSVDSSGSNKPESTSTAVTSRLTFHFSAAARPTRAAVSDPTPAPGSRTRTRPDGTSNIPASSDATAIGVKTWPSRPGLPPGE